MIRLKGQGWARIRMIETWWLFSKQCDTRPWYNNRILLIGPPIKEKRGKDVQHKAIVLISRPIKCGPRGFFPSLMITIQQRSRFFLLADQLERCYRGLDPYKWRHWKGKSQIEGWFHRQKTKAFAAGFATQSPELDHSEFPSKLPR